MFLIYGQRRVGKSSLLKFLPRLLGSRFKVISQDFQNAKLNNNKRKNITQEDVEQIIKQDIIQCCSNALSTFWTEFCEYHQCKQKSTNKTRRLWIYN